MSNVEPQVTGIIQQRLFTEGSIVKAGQSLYQIDPRPYQAALDQAAGQLAQAQANLVNARLDLKRYQSLVGQNAISQQTLDTQVALVGSDEGIVKSDRANVEAAEINLRYTKVIAPLTGRIGASAVTIGALVTANQSTPLSVISTLDPIYVDINQSSDELLALEQQARKGQVNRNEPLAAKVSLKLGDGSTYPLEGKLQFTDVTVNQTTGTVLLRALFPNPDGVLLPGLYVRAVINEGVDPHGILVPQTAVGRDAKDQPTVLVLDDQNTTRLQGHHHRPHDRWRLAGAGRPQARRKSCRAGADAADGKHWARHESDSDAGQDPGPSRFRHTIKGAPHGVIALLHRPSGFRLGDRDRDHAGGRHLRVHPADRAISHHRAARGGGERVLSRRRRRHGAEFRHPGDRAAAHRPRQSSLFLVQSRTPTARCRITATFAPGTNPDIAQVQVQNKVQQAVAQLPSQVQQRASPWPRPQTNFLLDRGALRHQRTATTMSTSADFMVSKMQDPLSRVTGVGNVQVFGAQYAMRIWLDPYKLHDFALEPSDVAAAIQAQNVQVSAGQIGGQPAVPGQADQRHRHRAVAASDARSNSATSSSRPRQAARWCICRDVARVELGADTYGVVSTHERPARRRHRHHAGARRQRASTGGCGEGAAPMALVPQLPPGVKMDFPVDNTEFIRLSIRDVVITLVEAILLVILVMYHLPAELAHHPGARGRGAGGAAGHLRRAGGVRLFHQHAHPVRAGAGDRPSGR